MITLLLALFIVLFAMSTIDAHRFNAVRKTLAQSFRGQVIEEPGNVLDSSPSVLEDSNPSQAPSKSAFSPVAESDDRAQSHMAKEQQNLKQELRAAGLRVNDADKTDVEVTTTERGLVVRLAGDTFFESGSDAIKPSLGRALTTIATTLRDEPRQISVEGHTDGQPISTERFPDNLALSSARAASIYRFLQGHGMQPERMRAVGYADTRPVIRPTHPHDEMSRNRRVEIVVIAPGGGDSEPGAQFSEPTEPNAAAQLDGHRPSATPGSVNIIGQIVGTVAAPAGAAP